MLFPFSPYLADVAQAARIICANYGPHRTPWGPAQVILAVLLALIVVGPWLMTAAGMRVVSIADQSRFVMKQLGRTLAVGVLLCLLVWGGFFP